jgi:hypothetical protein
MISQEKNREISTPSSQREREREMNPRNSFEIEEERERSVYLVR